MPPGLERERGKRKKGAVSDSEVPSFGLQGGQFPLKAGAVLASSLLPILWYYKINGKGYVFLTPYGLRPCCRREVFFSGPGRFEAGRFSFPALGGLVLGDCKAAFFSGGGRFGAGSCRAAFFFGAGWFGAGRCRVTFFFGSGRFGAGVPRRPGAERSRFSPGGAPLPRESPFPFKKWVPSESPH